jgi:hypothetical protein
MMVQGEIIIPPDPNLIISQVVPVMEMVMFILVGGFITLGPIGRAVGDVIRHVFGAGKKAAALPPGDLDGLHARLDAVQHQLTEIAERQDFAERMMAKTRERGALGAGGE